MGWSIAIFCVAAVHAVEVAENATQMLHLHLAASVDSECSDTASVSRATCLGKSKCMFLELDKRNLRLPCEWAGQPLPCVPRNAAYPQGRVESCEMSCEHQQMVSKVSDCTDVSGEIRQDDCMAKGKSAGVSCMWTSYTRKDGTRRSMCGPCKVDGLGSVGRSAPGSYGPEAGSIVEASFSQCDAQQLEAAKPCLDPSKCPKTLPAIPPETGDAPVALSDLTRLGMNTTADAPQYFAAPVSPPYGKEEYLKAAQVAAAAAGYAAPEQLENVDVAIKRPASAPVVPSDFKEQPVKPLPGMLFPIPAFRSLTGGVLAEPGDSFRPRMTLVQSGRRLRHGAMKTDEAMRG